MLGNFNVRIIYKIRIIHGCGEEAQFVQLRTRGDFAMPNDIDRQTPLGGQNCLLFEQN